MANCQLVSGESGTQNLDFGFRKCHEEMGLGALVEKGFSSLYAKFLPYLIIFQSFSVPLAYSNLKIHQIWQKFAKK